MSDSSPTDLAIVFRSLPRRLREAGADLVGATNSSPGAAAGASPSPAADHLAAIDRHLARAAGIVHTAPRTSDPIAIADAIEAIPADAWGAELDELREIALDLGRRLRSVAAANPDLDPDD